MAPRKINKFQVDEYEVNCPFEDEAGARGLLEAFLPSMRIILNKTDKKLGKSVVQAGMPEIQGVGVEYDGELYTAFGEGFSITFLDKENLKRLSVKLSGAN